MMADQPLQGRRDECWTGTGARRATGGGRRRERDDQLAGVGLEAERRGPRRSVGTARELSCQHLLEEVSASTVRVRLEDRLPLQVGAAHRHADCVHVVQALGGQPYHRLDPRRAQLGLADHPLPKHSVPDAQAMQQRLEWKRVRRPDRPDLAHEVELLIEETFLMPGLADESRHVLRAPA